MILVKKYFLKCYFNATFKDPLRVMCKRSFHTNNIRAINRKGPHNIDVISVIIGSLLGDAYGSRRSGEGVRFCYRQSIKHKEYLFWLYEFFYSKGYTSNLKPREYTRKIKHRQTEYKGPRQWGSSDNADAFNTFTFRSFNWIYELFYKKGPRQRVISPRITEYITPLALAVWIMDDGCWTNSGVRIAARRFNSFTLSEVTILNDILKQKYELDTTIQSIWIAENNAKEKKRDRYCIYIKKNSIEKLKCIILPHIHKSMYYKLGPKAASVGSEGSEGIRRF